MMQILFVPQLKGTSETIVPSKSKQEGGFSPFLVIPVIEDHRNRLLRISFNKVACFYNFHNFAAFCIGNLHLEQADDRLIIQAFKGF